MAIAATAALPVSGCSPSTTPGLFPTVLAEPTPRNDTPLTPDQVKQAMDNLVSDRNHLCSQAMATEGPGGAPADCGPQNVTGAIPAAGAGAKP